jgi:GT2 family glycosyltransferase
LNAQPQLVSVVVPTFRRRASVLRLLGALRLQEYPAQRFEVVVVDDGSGDDTVASLRALETPFTLRVLEQSHEGPGAARNLGVAESAGELIVFLDDDVVPDSRLIAAHVAANSIESTVVVGPMLPPDGWRRPAWIRWEESKLVRQYRAMSEGVFTCTYRQFFTANASLRRERFLAAGGFDASFVRAEDVDLGFRLHEQGGTFVFAPEARVWHYPQRSFESWSKTPYRYGQADVVMRGKGNPALAISLDEFHERPWLSRLACRASVGRPILFRASTFALGAAARVLDAFRVERLADVSLSGLFNLLYWQGVSDALGDTEILRRATPRLPREVPS